MARRVVWGEWNRDHLTERGRARGFTIEDIETVLADGDTEVVPVGARDYFLGLVRGRRLTVVAMANEAEIYPLTAFWADESRWRSVRERQRSDP